MAAATPSDWKKVEAGEGVSRRIEATTRRCVLHAGHPDRCQIELPNGQQLTA